MHLANARKDFPIFMRTVNGHALVYLDNAATTQKPYPVIAAVSDFYARTNANIHRGIHSLSVEATEAYERVRGLAREFINAKSSEEIVFTSGTTESLNLLAAGYAQVFCRKGDMILLTDMEHHSNIVPWQEAARKHGLRLSFIPITADGKLDMTACAALLRKRKPRLLSIAHASNVLGTVNPVAQIARAAHRAGAHVAIDAAQSIGHLPIDVRRMDCDFLVFSGHKMYAPMGSGVLYGRKTLLERLPPLRYGGQMVEQVGHARSAYTQAPGRFEGGTMPVADIIGLGAAIQYLKGIGVKKIAAYEKMLAGYVLEKLLSIEGLSILGPQNIRDRLGVFSFVLSGIPPHDIASLLDARGIAVRSGHHCAQILHDALGHPYSTRLSLSFYNTKADIDALVRALRNIQRIFKAD